MSFQTELPFEKQLFFETKQLLTIQIHRLWRLFLTLGREGEKKILAAKDGNGAPQETKLKLYSRPTNLAW